MNLLLRLIKVAIMAWRRPPLEPLGDSLVSFRVWPNDLDLNLHMNNGRYLTLMDLGRIDLTIRTGIIRMVLKQGWRPMVAAATIRYRRGLRPFQRYDLRTRILCWDHKWFFMEQRFEVAGELYALALVKGLFVGPRDKITPQEVAQAVGHDGISPPMPEAVRAWLQWEPLA
ncbi:MAG: thioesterase family protein [Desulfarculus sp.]|nr:thioesterase family protein [Desulfarculus sp.]